MGVGRPDRYGVFEALMSWRDFEQVVESRKYLIQSSICLRKSSQIKSI